MNGAILQAKINYGFAKSGQYTGVPFNVYRATSGANPIVAGNLVATLPASFNAQNWDYVRAIIYGKPLWFAAIDGSQTKPGDFLVSTVDSRVFFIAAQQPLLSILAVDCNRVITLLRPEQLTGVGGLSYGGDTESQETAYCTGYPASILQGTKGEKNLVNLPGDVRTPWWAVLLPAIPGGFQIKPGDILTDDLSRRYVISSPELSDLGWRLTATQVET